MNLVIGGRRAGKTTKLIKMAHHYDACILVINKAEAERVSVQAEEMDKPIRYPVTFSEFFSGRMRGSSVRKILIDNAEQFIEHACFGLDIEAISLTHGDGKECL